MSFITNLFKSQPEEVKYIKDNFSSEVPGAGITVIEISKTKKKVSDEAKSKETKN